MSMIANMMIKFYSSDIDEDLKQIYDFIREVYGNITVCHTVSNDCITILTDCKDFDTIGFIDNIMQQGPDKVLRNFHLLDCLLKKHFSLKTILITELFKKITANKEDGQEVFTYIIQDVTTNLFKIGKTKNITKRFSALSCGNPHLKFAGFVDVDTENELHHFFREKKYKREWYRLNDEDLKILESDYDFIIVP